MNKKNKLNPNIQGVIEMRNHELLGSCRTRKKYFHSPPYESVTFYFDKAIESESKTC
jgi:hypothetical protein